MQGKKCSHGSVYKVLWGCRELTEENAASMVQTIIPQSEADIKGSEMTSETVTYRVVFLSPNQAKPKLLVNM